MKLCTRCRTRKPPADFRTNSRCRDGLSSWCRACHNAATREYRARVRAELAELRALRDQLTAQGARER